MIARKRDRRGWRKRKRDTKVETREETSVKTDGPLAGASLGTKATGMNETSEIRDGRGPMTKTATTPGVLDDDEPLRG